MTTSGELVLVYSGEEYSQGDCGGKQENQKASEVDYKSLLVVP